MSNRLRWIILIVVILVVAGGVFLYWYFVINPDLLKPAETITITKQEEAEPEAEEKFIVSNPLDLDQVNSISQFRSCQGHDYSGLNIDGELEENRSMKHYIFTIDMRSNKVKALAPFDGEIVNLRKEQVGNNYQVWINGPTSGEWDFVFFHLILAEGIKKGAKVKAGDLIGHAEFFERSIFDIALQKVPEKIDKILEKYQEQGMDAFMRDYQKGVLDLKKGLDPERAINVEIIYDSPFFYMSDEVLKEYTDRGITLDNIIATEEERDKDPCNFTSSGSEKPGEVVDLK